MEGSSPLRSYSQNGCEPLNDSALKNYELTHKVLEQLGVCFLEAFGKTLHPNSSTILFLQLRNFSEQRLKYPKRVRFYMCEFIGVGFLIHYGIQWDEEGRHVWGVVSRVKTLVDEQ